MAVSIGDIVLYKLTQADAEAIARSRKSALLGRVGNPVDSGDVFPLMVTHTYGNRENEVNGQVFLDGNDRHWVVSRPEGDLVGMWKEKGK